MSGNSARVNEQIPDYVSKEFLEEQRARMDPFLTWLDSHVRECEEETCDWCLAHFIDAECGTRDDRADLERIFAEWTEKVGTVRKI